MFGGGPRGTGDLVVHLAAVPCLALGILRWQTRAATRWQRVFLLWCLAVLALGLLQMLPLPGDWFARLPQRAGVAADLQTAGIALGWRPMTLDLWGSIRATAAFAVFLAMWLLATTLPPASRPRLLKLALGVAVLEALLGFAQAAAGVHSPLRFYAFHHPIGAIGTFANRNHFATLLAMLAPVALAWGVDAYYRRDRVTLVAWHGVALVLFLAAALTFSRAGFALTLVLMLAAMAVPVGRRAARWRWQAAVAFAALALGAVGAYAWDGLARRLAQDPLDDMRWQYLHYGLDAARQYLPWGSGQGSFRWVYAALEPMAAMINSYADRAHNDLLQVAVEAGVPGLLLVVLLIGLVAAMGFKAFRAAPNVDAAAAETRVTPVLARVVALAVWAPLLHSLVDYPLRTLAVAVLMALMLSVLFAPPQPAPMKSARPRPE